MLCPLLLSSLPDFRDPLFDDSAICVRAPLVSMGLTKRTNEVAYQKYDHVLLLNFIKITYVYPLEFNKSRRLKILCLDDFIETQGVIQTYRTMGGTTIAKPMETLIRQKLTQALDPQHLAIFNESYMHNVPKGSESHFKVVVISDKFEKETLIKRHRMVNEVLQEELRSGLHALSIVAMTLSQWENSDKMAKPSPACRGGFGR